MKVKVHEWKHEREMLLTFQKLGMSLHHSQKARFCALVPLWNPIGRWSRAIYMTMFTRNLRYFKMLVV